jgi:hypothetical protein
LGGEFAKKKYKMSNARGFARPPGGGGNKWLVHNFSLNRMVVFSST